MIELKAAFALWVGYAIFQSLLGFFLVRGKTKQAVVWALAIFSVFIPHFLFLEASPVIRMMALIIPLLHSMKIVVANIHPKGRMSFQNWLVYYFMTVNMNPSVFANKTGRVVDFKLLRTALLHLLLGSAILAFLRLTSDVSLLNASSPLFWGYSLLALFSLSITLHFGLLPLNTFMLKLAGYPDYPVFKQPFKSKSISEFWGRRWNLAFSEMTAISTFKPLAKQMGVKWAGFISFMVSGLLHEIAMSLSVMKSFGLPMLFFVVHGVLMSVEKKAFKSQKPGTLWVVMALVLPLPLLFHEAFLREVVWKVIYFGD